MILSVGARTDIVNHYGDWLMERFREGYVFLRNPLFPNRVTRYVLTPDEIDAIYFCSKNYQPFLANAAKLSAQYRTLYHYTVTAYGKDLEPAIPSVDESIQTLLRLCHIVGREKVVWRYDPILLTKTYTAERHAKTFEYIASALSGTVSHCIIGFVEMHSAIKNNIPDLIPLTLRDREQICCELAKIAKRYRISPQLCRGTPEYEKYGLDVKGCVRLDLIGAANGSEFRNVKHRGNRRWCLCIESRDVGAYESCPNLCKYCNANTDAEAVAQNRAVHDLHSPLLIGSVQPTDIIIQGVQESFLKHDGKQLSLFDR